MNHGPFRLKDGWYVMVNGRTYGTWDSRGAALAGYQTELRRAANKVTS